MRRSSSRAIAALLVARAVIEAVAFACLLALAHLVGGLEPIALTPATFALLGATLVLLAVLRETASEARGTTVLVVTLGVSLLLAIVLPTRPLDVTSWLGRIIVFAILAEIYLWRVVSIARGAVRWSDARNAVPFVAGAITLLAIFPAPLDRSPLVPLAFIVVAAAAVALSVARAAEELSLAKGQAGPARLSSANSVVFALGIATLAAAVAAPAVEGLLQDVGTALAPLYEQITFYLLLPLGYLAALVFAILEPLLRGLGFATVRTDRSQPFEQDEALMREIERTRPFVIGGLEVLIILVVIVVALVLLERAVRERRLTLPEGAEIERGTTAGLSLADTLRSLFPRRRAVRRAPHDDGSPAAALRLVYWRLLALAERTGRGWREKAETPSEHQRRLAGADARWTAASPIVAAFEDLRYGELDPDRATVTRARDALRAVEASLRT